MIETLQSDNLSQFEQLMSVDPNVDRILELSTPEILSHHPPLISVSAFFNAEQCFNYLHVNGADLRQCDEKEIAPIHFAAAGGSIQIIQEMIDDGIDVGITDSRALTPIHYAAHFGQLEALQTLWMQGQSITASSLARTLQTGLTPLHLACETDNEEVIRFLISSDCKIDAIDGEGKTPLHHAAAHSLVAVNILLELGADPLVVDNFEKTPIQTAVEVGKNEIIDVLLPLAEDDIESVLFTAAECGQCSVIETIVNEYHVGPDVVDDIGLTPLCYAIKAKKYLAIQKLCKIGSNPNHTDISKNTPLHLAVKSNDNAAVSILLKFGADPHIQNIVGKSPLDIANPQIAHTLAA